MAAKNREARLVIRLTDHVSGPAKAVIGSLRALDRTVKGAKGGVVAAGRAALAPSQAVGTLARRPRGRAGDSALVSGAVGYGAAAAGRNVYDYEKMGNAAQAVGIWSDAQREALEQYGKKLNEEFPFTNKEILAAAFELGRAGQTIDQTLGSLRSTLNVSLAGDLGLQDTADIMTNVAQAMRLPIETAEQTEETMKRIGDALAYAATNSNTDIAQMGIVFKYVAPIAAATGMSLEELAATSMVLANNGIKASNAGTGLRFAMSSMLKPTKEALKAFDLLGINVKDFVQGARQLNSTDIVQSLALDGIDVTGMEKSIDAVLNDSAIKKSPAKLVAALSALISDELGSDGIVDQKVLSDSLAETLTVLGTNVDFGGLLKALRDNPDSEALLPTIFGKRHAPKIMAVLAQDVDEVLADLEEKYSGAADRMSKIRMKGVVGDWMRLVAAIDNFTLTLSDSGVLESARKAISGITGVISDLGKTSPKVLEMATYSALALAAIAPLGFAISGLGAVVSVLASPLTWVVAGLGYLAYLKWDGLVAGMKGFNAGFKEAINPETSAMLTNIVSKFDEWIGLAKQSPDLDGWSQWGNRLGQIAANEMNSIQEMVQGTKDFVAWCRTVPEQINGIFRTIAGPMRDLGGRIIQQLWDGMVAKFGAFMDWVRSIPGSVAGAIGNISLFGGAGTGGGSKPTAGGGNRLPFGHPGSGDPSTHGKRASGGPVRRGLTYEINEKGTETVTMGTNGYVGKNGGQSRPDITLNLTQHITGGDTETLAAKVAQKFAEQMNRLNEISIDGQDPLPE